MNLRKANKKRRRAILAKTILDPRVSYNHGKGNECAVGIGLNMMGEPSSNGSGIVLYSERAKFRKFFGMSYLQEDRLYLGDFSMRRMKDITRQETAAFIKSV